MKKKIFNATVGGYYLVSIVLGVMMALTISMTTADLWYHAYEHHRVMEAELTNQYGDRYKNWTEEKAQAWKEADAKLDQLYILRTYVPMIQVSEELYYMPGTGVDRRYYENYIPIFLMISAVLTVCLSVLVMEGRSANKAWRQKMLQAVSLAALLVLGVLAWQCAEHRMLGKWGTYVGMRLYGSITTWHVLAPIILMIIPLIGLKKLKLRKGDERQTSQKAIIGDLGGIAPGTKIAVEIKKAE